MHHDDDKRPRAEQLVLNVAGNVLAGLIIYYVVRLLA
jgi:hypothetical protein